MRKTLGNIGLLFETSWEVCNKIGGIYTVLSTKAKVLKDQFGDNLVFIGPDVWTSDNPSPYFVEKKTLLKSAATKLKLPEGLSIRVGRWDVPGSPLVVLVKFDGVYPGLDGIFGEMWEHYKVDSLHSYGDYAEGCAFAVASAMVMKALAEHLKVPSTRVVAHFNEWTTGMGLLWLKLHFPGAATLFTTHATSIGRSICGNGKNLYAYFKGYNGDQMARELNMESKHSLEKAAAHQADCFTAVSEITARECEQLLDIRPQVVTPNGFEPGFVCGGSKYARLRRESRSSLLEIASAMSGKKYSDDTFIVATSGRNEYRNKGLDIYLDSMAALSAEDSARDTLALVLVPAWVKEPSGELLIDLQDGGTLPVNPRFLTHRLNNEDSDSVAVRLRSLYAEGKFEKNMDVIYIPCYLDGGDGIVNISYYDLLPGLDMTVFASYYEPWGYTPLESVAFSVPTVTTDKSGFGQWVLSGLTPGLATSGVEVVERNDDSYDRTVSNIASILSAYRNASAAEVRAARKGAAATAEKADWKYFVAHYDRAFEVAQTRRDKRYKKK
ncbi:MAG: glycogen/starch synthase [Muribaculaceae bacterium]|nr:glycogen/starch synthase [Muribaculaceae bacterium]